MGSNTTLIIVSLIVIFIVLGIVYSININCSITTAADRDASKLKENFENYADPDADPFADIRNQMIDNFPCSTDCCMRRWDIPIDGLSPVELRDALNNKHRKVYYSSGYSCGNGPDGVGCPCITEEYELMLRSRGENAGLIKYYSAIDIARNDEEDRKVCRKTQTNGYVK